MLGQRFIITSYFNSPFIEPSSSHDPSSTLASQRLKASVPTLPHRSFESLQAPAVSCDDQPPSHVYLNYHQDSEVTINHQNDPEIYITYIYLSMSYYFDCDDVILKNQRKLFTNFMRRGNMLKIDEAVELG